MFCGKCGSKVDGAARFCPGCGAPILPRVNQDAGEGQPEPLAFGCTDAGVEKTPRAKRPKRKAAIIVGVAAVIVVAAVGAFLAFEWFPASSGPAYLLSEQVTYTESGEVQSETIYRYDEQGNILLRGIITRDSLSDGCYTQVEYRSDLELDDEGVAVSWMMGGSGSYFDSFDEAEAMINQGGDLLVSSDPSVEGWTPLAMQVTYDGRGGVSGFSLDSNGYGAVFVDGRLSSCVGAPGETTYSYERVQEGEKEVASTVYSLSLAPNKSLLEERFHPDDPRLEGSVTATVEYTAPIQIRGEDGSVTTVDRSTSTGTLSYDANGCLVTAEWSDGSRLENTWITIEKPNPLAKAASRTTVLGLLTEL